VKYHILLSFWINKYFGKVFKIYYLILCLVSLGVLSPAISYSQLPTDSTVRVNEEGAVARESPDVMSKIVTGVPEDTTLEVVGRLGSWYHVQLEDTTGYVVDQSLMSGKRYQYYERLRNQGFTISLLGQSLYLNSADGVTVSLELKNISESKVVKYLTIDWQLFNSVGDPVSGRNGTPSRTRVKFVGPVEPGSPTEAEFENLWYASTAACAVVQRIEVQHVDGSSFVYVNDLESISELADGVNLSGGCSYEAQHEEAGS